jgi:exodeoxyribonuclease X
MKSKYKLIFLDTETSGLTKEDRLCQLAYMYDDVVVDELFNPGRPIDIGAMAIHHITEDMVADKPDFKESEHHQILQDLLNEENSIFIAHNAQFDIGMVEREGITIPRHICTKKIAQYLNADNPNISKANLQYLRYYYGIDMEATAHDALGDILILKEVFYKLVETAIKKSRAKEPSMDKIVERMMDISMKPQMLKKMAFGKFKGYEMTTVLKADPGYLKWILESGKFDDDKSLIHTCKTLLKIE